MTEIIIEETFYLNFKVNLKFELVQKEGRE